MSDDIERCPHCGGHQIRNGVCRMCGYGGEEEYVFPVKKETHDLENTGNNIRQVTDNSSLNHPAKVQPQVPVSQFYSQQPVNQYVPQPPVNLPNLVQCPDCGNLVSMYATSCPTCGRPFVPLSHIDQNNIVEEERVPEKRRFNPIALIFGIILIIAGIYFAYNGGFHLGVNGLK